MFRSSLAFVAVSLLAIAAPCAAVSSPVPGPSSSPKAIKHGGGFSSGVRKPSGQSSHVSSAACNRRNVGTTSPTQRTMGPNGATQSNTLIAVPIGGGNVGSATEQHQISEACGHQR